MTRLLAAAAAVPIPTEVGYGPGSPLPPSQEAELRASALVLQAEERFCFISCDTLVVPRDVLEWAAAEVSARCGIAPGNLMICATHTHHAPCTIDILGCTRDAEFCDRIGPAILSAAEQACDALEGAAEAELRFSESQEASVGGNSRYLLRDGTIAWYAYPWEDVVRPTGPFDPDIPVLSVRRPDGEVVGNLFSHSVHNIGPLTRGKLSPAFQGLTAQEVSRRHGGVTLFLPGAFGSSHNTSEFGTGPRTCSVSGAECVHRMVRAVEDGLQRAERFSSPKLLARKRPFTYRLRHFDEAGESAAVEYWANAYTPDNPRPLQDTFARMREQMAPVQGQERETTLQVMLLGDVALVGVPCEMFAALGLEIRRRSPFRHTYVIGLANDTIGYVGDRASYELGGYQLWAGLHSLSEPGTGEAMVQQAVEMLQELQGAVC